MNISSKKVLITGGGSGIGLAMAKSFSEAGNKVVIVGRNEEKLKKAAAEIAGVAYLAADVTNEKDVESIEAFVNLELGGLDILVNNAAETNVYHLGAGAGSYEKAKAEMDTTFFSVVNLSEKLLPIMEKQPEAAIVNVNAVLGLVPSSYMPTHSASKAALRSYSQVLRFTLQSKSSPVKVFEVYPPLVKTDFSAAIGSATAGIPPEEVAEATLKGLENDRLEIFVGKTDLVYQKFFKGTEGVVDFFNQQR